MSKELFYRKRWLIMKYNIEPHCWHGGSAIQNPHLQKYFGSLTSQLFHYRHHTTDSMADKPQWVRTFMFGMKRPNYMMWNVGEGGHKLWNHSWQRYRVSNFEPMTVDLRGPEPR
ncbi:hypothetical protein DIPPA_33594 [Diplonema papillatum]|nr:hypothetical protein DIPPA_33594 [Diplonema papillatum]